MQTFDKQYLGYSPSGRSISKMQMKQLKDFINDLLIKNNHLHLRRSLKKIIYRINAELVSFIMNIWTLHDYVSIVY